METKEKQILWGTAAIIILLVVLFVFSKGFDSDSSVPSGETDESITETTEEPRVMEKGAEETLSAFPEGFPVEGGYTEAEGYVYVPANSLEKQSTLEYTSKRSLSENAVRFREFLVAGEYEIVNEINEDGLAFFYATKSNNDLSITVEESNGKVVVSASYLKRN